MQNFASIAALVGLLLNCQPLSVTAAVVEYDLNIVERVLAPAGKPVKVLTLWCRSPSQSLRVL